MLLFYLGLRPDTKEYLLIKEEVGKVLSKVKAPGVLRLVFHDAGTFEMDDNTGMKMRNIISQITTSFLMLLRFLI